MPTENERKYVINIACEKNIDENFKAYINQGYMAYSKGMTIRIRRKEYVDHHNHHNIEHYITYKQKSLSRIIEIEQEIDKRDYDELWHLSKIKLYKIRYNLFDADTNLWWEIDFLKNNNKTYFALAEVELPEGVEKPRRIHPFVEKFLIYEVSLKDNRFSNRRLANCNYSKDLYKKLTKVKNDRQKKSK